MTQQCFQCQHWKSKDNKGQTHSMAQYGFGVCHFSQNWRYFSANKQCDQGQFLRRTNEEIEVIAQWLK